MHHTRRFAAAVLLVAGATALLAGCDSASDTSSAATGTEKPSKPASDGPAPCAAGDAEAEMVPAGESSEPDSWNAMVYLTNVGKAECRLEGAGELTFYADPDTPIDRKQRAPDGDGPAEDLVVVGPGEKAEMAVHYGSAAGDTAPGNCPTPALARVVLPGDAKPIEVAPPEEMAAMPPLCGEEIQVSPWAASA